MKGERQIDNDTAAVTRWTLAEGDEIALHRHELDYVVVPLAAGLMQITDAYGSQVTTELEPGQTYFRKAGAEHVVRALSPLVDFVEVEVVRPVATPNG